MKTSRLSVGRVCGHSAQREHVFLIIESQQSTELLRQSGKIRKKVGGTHALSALCALPRYRNNTVGSSCMKKLCLLRVSRVRGPSIRNARFLRVAAFFGEGASRALDDGARCEVSGAHTLGDWLLEDQLGEEPAHESVTGSVGVDQKLSAVQINENACEVVTALLWCCYQKAII